MTGVFRCGLMSSGVTLSLNELRALLRKAFEGIYGHDHDWNALTDLVLWLEFHDLDGLKIFFDAEPGLPCDIPNLSEGDNGDILIDGKGGSFLQFNVTSCDLLVSKAKTAGQAVLHVNNTKHVQVITASVARCASSGLAAAAWWPSEENSAYIAFQEAGARAPNLFRVSLPAGFENYEGVTIIAAPSIKDIQTRYQDWFQFQKSGQTPSNEIEERYQQHLDHGFAMSVDDYKRLCHYADRVLVEATEQSRRGAGE